MNQPPRLSSLFKPQIYKSWYISTFFRQTSFLFNLLTIFIWLPMIERANKWKRKVRHFYQYQFRYVFSLYFHLVEIDRYLGGQIELLLSIFFTKWRQYLKQWLKHFFRIYYISVFLFFRFEIWVSVCNESKTKVFRRKSVFFGRASSISLLTQKLIISIFLVEINIWWWKVYNYIIIVCIIIIKKQ